MTLQALASGVAAEAQGCIVIDMIATAITAATLFAMIMLLQFLWIRPNVEPFVHGAHRCVGEMNQPVTALVLCLLSLRIQFSRAAAGTPGVWCIEGIGMFVPRFNSKRHPPMLGMPQVGLVKTGETPPAGPLKLKPTVTDGAPTLR